MAAGHYPWVHREGWPWIAVAALSALLLHRFADGYWAIPAWVAAIFLIYLFRDPDRRVPAAPLAVVCPADGRVTAVAPARDPYLGRDALRISLRMNLLGSYATRSPVEARVVRIWPAPPEGATGVGDLRHGIHFQTDEGDDLVFALRPGPPGSSVRCYIQEGERIGQGQRCGFMRFGVPLEIFLPANARTDLTVGDRLRAGTDILATLVHK